jgi:hypothetical protein
MGSGAEADELTAGVSTLPGAAARAITENARIHANAIGRNTGNGDRRRVREGLGERFRLRDTNLAAAASWENTGKRTDFVLRAADSANLENWRSGKRGEPASHSWGWYGWNYFTAILARC